jgi:hypothetical protein
VSRDELNARELEELAALDLILAREPVGEEHLELAALVDSVRAGAPTMAPAFAERLDAQLTASDGAAASAGCATGARACGAWRSPAAAWSPRRWPSRS